MITEGKQNYFLEQTCFHREPTFSPIFLPEACNFIKKETLAQVISCELLKKFKKTFFTEHLRTTAL